MFAALKCAVFCKRPSRWLLQMPGVRCRSSTRDYVGQGGKLVLNKAEFCALTSPKSQLSHQLSVCSHPRCHTVALHGRHESRRSDCFRMMLSAILCCASIDQQTCDSYRSMALTSVKHSKFSLVTLAGGEPGLLFTGMRYCEEGFSPRRNLWAGC